MNGIAGIQCHHGRNAAGAADAKSQVPLVCNPFFLLHSHKTNGNSQSKFNKLPYRIAASAVWKNVLLAKNAPATASLAWRANGMPPMAISCAAHTPP
jgi:hypothetical protein